ncbi:DUF4385 family protein [Nocardioides deserti]|uniref:DUF4385 family protein n=1 Tax=Nocardioides deserti TaxID=1588644 RepID=A0ABR6U4R9_9ACTN|nr:DUF4385 family protein [Nocardioides deserti]MBC2959432.1 DUF4385 family protein [Nocardioides deserti]GGO73497.1 hypothetical protein GCM10012276_19250 [Nocardioides deserti]
MRGFDYSLDYASLDLREHPELYAVGRGEQGVFHVEPYKSELLPLWEFATVEKAERSSAAITERFRGYLADGDFVGADLARKYLQMGYTRARRYANRQEGEKAQVKAQAAAVFKAAWDAAAGDATYRRLRQEHREKYDA